MLANVGDNFGSLGTEPLPKVGEPELLGDGFPVPVEVCSAYGVCFPYSG